jgi:hypothetical protein
MLGGVIQQLPQSDTRHLFSTRPLIGVSMSQPSASLRCAFKNRARNRDERIPHWSNSMSNRYHLPGSEPAACPSLSFQWSILSVSVRRIGAISQYRWRIEDTTATKTEAPIQQASQQSQLTSRALVRARLANSLLGLIEASWEIARTDKTNSRMLAGRGEANLLFKFYDQGVIRQAQLQRAHVM